MPTAIAVIDGVPQIGFNESTLKESGMRAMDLSRQKSGFRGS